ncbi:MAG: ankyrin repeat domain-containing protein, partial [Candidatus Accumulibacter sp.]|nr:ankyrin repeat domain-containing protein [Accumulibacter sp.]
ALGMACFMGFADIARELIQRGAKANFPDNTIPTSPLSMALRGKHIEVVRVLVEMGVNIPPGVQTGLSGQEIETARQVATQNAASGEHSHFIIEEIDMVGCYGTDTSVLEADVIRAARKMNDEKHAAKS